MCNLPTIHLERIMQAFLIGLILSGCVSSPTSFQTPAAGTYEVIGLSKGRAGGVLLFNLIPIGHGSRITRASQKAVDKLGGDGIIDVTVSDKWWWAGVVFGNVASVEGTVIRYINKEPKKAGGDRRASPDQERQCSMVGGTWVNDTCVFEEE